MKLTYDGENTPAERLVGNVLAALAGLAFAGVFYYVLTEMFHIPHRYALPSVIVIGVVEFFCLRIWLLVVGARKGDASGVRSLPLPSLPTPRRSHEPS